MIFAITKSVILTHIYVFNILFIFDTHYLFTYIIFFNNNILFIIFWDITKNVLVQIKFHQG